MTKGGAENEGWAEAAAMKMYMAGFKQGRAPMKRQNIAIGVLALGLFFVWGERRMLEAQFDEYVQTLHWPEAHAECSKVARSEHGAAIAKKDGWRPEGLTFGTHPDAWPWRYVKWGQFWNVANAAATLHYVYADSETTDVYRCNYIPAGGGHARVERSG